MTDQEYLNITSDEAHEDAFIEHLSKVAGVPADRMQDIPDSMILNYVKIEMASFPNEISISCGMTRQKQQYCPNVYHVSMKVDVSTAKSVIIAAVAAAPEGEKLTVYNDLKSFWYRSIMNRYSTHEKLLRGGLIARAKEDGVALPDEA